MKKQLIFLPILLATATSGAEHSYPTTNEKMAQIKNLGPAINTPEAEYTPFITPDEKFLFFQSNRQPSVGADGDFDLWYSVNKNKDNPNADPVFEAAANVGMPINSDMLDGHPTLRKLGSGEFEMYFASFATAGRGGPALTNLYFSTWKAGKWSDPVPVAELNTEYHDRMPSVSQDGKILFFSSDRPGGHGNDDIWYSEWDTAKKKWGPAKNAGGINTAASEFTPALHADGITLYFSSNKAGGVGGSDIYFTQSIARLENEKLPDILAKGWTVPQNLGKPYNSEFDDEYPTAILNGERMYFTSNRAEGLGSYDIYTARLPEFARPVIVLTFTGKTTTGRRKKPVAAKIHFKSGDIDVSVETTADAQSNYTVPLRNYHIYEFEATAEGYKTVTEKVDTSRIHTSAPIEQNFSFIRSAELPEKVTLEIEFVDAKKKPVNPTVSVNSGGPETRPMTLTPVRGKVVLPLMELTNHKDKDAAMAALDDLVLQIDAKKKGMVDVSMRREISAMLDDIKGPIPAVLKIQIVTESAKSTKPAKGKTKGKKGKKR